MRHRHTRFYCLIMNDDGEILTIAHSSLTIDYFT